MFKAGQDRSALRPGIPARSSPVVLSRHGSDASGKSEVESHVHAGVADETQSTVEPGSPESPKEPDRTTWKTGTLSNP